jgi:hypothetical protein
MGEKDIAFRRLLRDLPEPVLRLVFGRRRFKVLGVADASADRSVQRTTDNLFRVREGRRECIVHIEIERSWNKSIAPRMFDYASAAHAATRLPVVSIVLLLRRGGRPPGRRATYEVGALGGELRQRYYVLPLYELDARRMQRRLPPEGWPLCVAMRGSDSGFVRRLGEELELRKDVPEERKESISTLLFVVTAAILGAHEARRLFEMDAILQSPGVQDLIRQLEEEGRAKGLAEGLAEGRAKGRAEGRAEHARDLLLRQLRARFGEIPASVAERVHAAELAELDRWAERVVTAATVDEVFVGG